MNPWHGKKVPAAAVRNKTAASAGARWLALQSLLAFSQQGIFVGRTLDELFSQHRTPPRERRLATELAAETIRRGLSLDAILSHYVVRPRESVEPDLWQLLQLGVCQLLCLFHIPPHAAVHETVALCEQLGKPRAKGFVNGTLRSIEREILNATIRTSQTNENDFPRADSQQILPEDLHQNCGIGMTFQPAHLTLRDLRFEHLTGHLWPVVVPRGTELELHCIELARSVFASPQENAVDYISQISGLPAWLIQRWDTQFGDRRKILELALWYTTPGRMSLRVNPEKNSRAGILQMLRDQGVRAEAGVLPESIQLAGSIAVGDLPEFQSGGFSVQDESAMQATHLLNPQRGEAILDLCAAPGGKSCHLAECLQGTGRVVACDVSEERLRTITHNINRLQLKNIEVWAVTPDGEHLPPGPFDAALVDVPCSNTGVLGKRPEARWRLTPTSLVELIPLQKRLLNQALDRVRSGGRVVYSTCSIDREENEQVVRAVLAGRSDSRLISEMLHWPGHPADGGFQALIQRD